MPNIAKSLISKNHPDYNHFLNDWIFFDQSYTGGRDWIYSIISDSAGKDLRFISSNVFRHSREVKEDYERRLKRFVYTNYCEPVITIFTSHLFGTGVQIARNTEIPDIADFYSDVDGCGCSIDDFMQDVAVSAQVFGGVGVLVDLPRVEVDIRTQADVQSNNIRPYISCYEPPAIVDWSVDNRKQLNWVRLKESSREDADPFLPTKNNITRYRTWTRDAWYLHDASGVELASGEHPLGKVPFVFIPFKKHRRKPLIGISQLQDIARINRLLCNIISYIEEFAEIQAFPFLAAPLGIAGADEDTIISTKHIFEYPPEGNPPAYVSPPTDPARFMLEFVSTFLRKEIYRLAKLENRELMEQSGVAKQYDFHQTSSAIGRFARNLEIGENSIMDFWSAWQGQEWDNSTDYPDDFDVNPVNDDLKAALDVRDLYGDQSPTLVAEHLKRLAKRIEPKLSKELTLIIDGELESKAAMAAQEEAFNRGVENE